jgi:phosphoribosylanthranilate isomerase
MMNPVRVKICGVRAFEEAEAAIEAGADALGFNFWPKSPRFIEPDEAGRIIEKLPPEIASIGVFVNEESQHLLSVALSAGLRAVQLHGDETPEYCAALGRVRIIKALRVGQNFGLQSMAQYTVNSLLLDTAVTGSYGGTGKVFDWTIAIEAKKFAPIILAGGLTVENVAGACLQVKPAAVDVCSGVEAEPGRKDMKKMRRFFAEVARANQLILDETDNGFDESEFTSPF